MYPGERFNSWSHLIGSLLAIIATVVLIVRGARYGDAYHVVAAAIYGSSLILLYSASTFYHSLRSPRAKRFFKKIDHCAIYLLIAGSYTPYTLITLRGAWGWSIFGVSWALALIGIAQEFIFAKGNRVLSLVLYLTMGWLVLVAIMPIVEALAAPGLIWLAVGGVFYTLGVYWYVNDEKIRHGHGIWHVFVLAGSVAQFISIYGWVIGYSGRG
ncbi:hemolysin III family protein [Suttonella sp. R2A3]|uniref:PAQR family membrane homeostasis protein TrhA n=1 Tax=Suttonella sp. R2A3 TaxID=2908648 RepID=UPI001F412718|nr:hemolysin III family protein [Suttonella sp. R2A3]UJF23745.1 hemolysin III family protein [Suttonella sp. R2A3]